MFLSFIFLSSLLRELKNNIMLPRIQIKRAYEKPSPKDGFRVLADRLWPRGLRKEEASVKEWCKDLAPTPALRKWFGHDPEKWQAFKAKYLHELKQNPAVEDFVATHASEKIITLVYAAKDTEHNQAIVLQQYLTQCFKNAG